jgi:hypothetical protein
VPNPDLVMVVYPHLARGKYPVPGYVTTFPMYDEVIYALPGEVELGQLQAQARQVEFSQAKAAQAKAQADAAAAQARQAQDGR